MNSSVTQTAREVDNTVSSSFDSNTEDLVERLRNRAIIRRKLRLSREGHERDRIADVLEEAADKIESCCR